MNSRRRTSLAEKRRSRQATIASSDRGSSAKPFSSEVKLSETAQGKASTALILTLLASLTVAVYARVAGLQFVNFDDGPYVFENSHVMNGLHWRTIIWAFTSFDAANWHPLTWISHALDCQIYGLNPTGHHVTSLLLHVANAVVLCMLLLRFTGATWRSFLVAALFAIHPLNVESVAWIAERKNLLCTFFFLLGLAGYGWYARRPSIPRYLAVTGFFLLGLASKPMVITFPFVLLLLDYWPLGRIQGWSSPSANFQMHQARFSRLALEKLPLVLLSLASGVITVVAQHGGGAVASGGWSASWRVQNAIHAYATYLCKLFFPLSLAPFYPGAMLHWWQVAWATGLLLFAGYCIWRFHVGRPYLITGSLWFFLTLVPAIGLVQVGSQAMADRYAYIPMLGILVIAVWAGADIAKSQSIGRWEQRAIAILVLAVLAVITSRQIDYWKSSYSLWTRALEVTGSNFMAEGNLGMSLLDMGREDEAFEHFQRALASEPHDPLSLLSAGTYLVRHGRYQESIEKLEQFVLIARSPAEMTRAYRGLGVAYAELGNREKARANFLRALQITPQDPADMENLGKLVALDAVDNLKSSLTAHPTPRGYLQLGQLLQQSGRVPDAQMAYKQALRLDPQLVEAHQALRALGSRPQ